MTTKYTSLLKVLILLLLPAMSAYAQLSGNPILSGDHPDPEVNLFNGKYYIYPTNEGLNEFHAYSSADLTNWVDEGTVFSVRTDCSWAEVNGWAPSVIYRNNKYYFYYTAELKIGVAVGNSPTGPFTDLGYPLIATDPYTVDIIDPFVFIDDDGQAYIYYGGSNGSRMVVRKLNTDMISFASGPADITPQNYTEGPFLIKRDGIYYMTYSNGAWYNETYNVQYATSTSPMGPWTYKDKILSSDGSITGPGHHSVVQIPGCDDYYMVYHRYDNGNYGQRTCNIDRMYFEPDGSIRRIQMTTTGVPARVPTTGVCSTGNIFSGATYKLIHKGTNQCLDVDNNSAAAGANVQQWTDNGTLAQQWVVTLEADGNYKLTHKNTNQCLDVVNNSATPGTNVQQWTDNSNDAQRWTASAMVDGYYKLTHKGTNQCLDVADNSSAEGTNVQQWTDNANNAQRWKMVLVASPAITSGMIYELEPRCAPGKRLDVSGGVDANGSNVQIYEQNHTIAQAWQINDVGNGYYELIPQCATGRRLDVGGSGNTNGTNIHIWETYSNSAQRYKFLDQGNGYYEIEPECAPGKRVDVSGMLQSNGTNVHLWEDYSNAAQQWKLILKSTATITSARTASEAVSLNTPGSETSGGIVYPNPNEGSIQVKFSGRRASIIINDALGHERMPVTAVRSGEIIDISHLEKGLYFIQVDIDGVRRTERIIKK